MAEDLDIISFAHDSPSHVSPSPAQCNMLGETTLLTYLLYSTANVTSSHRK